jgi:hypothetical protein
MVLTGYVEDEADQDVRVITGGADELLRGYRLNTHTQSGEVMDAERKTLLGDDETVFEYFGALKRTAVLAQQGSIEKCSALRINSAGTLLAAQSTGKVVEVGHCLSLLRCVALLHRVACYPLYSSVLCSTLLCSHLIFCDSISVPFSLHLCAVRLSAISFRCYPCRTDGGEGQ